jgi:hypothetical protein
MITAALLLILTAPDPMSPPPMVSVDEQTCGPCTSGAQCVAGQCQFTCQTNADCRRGLICGGSGVCEPNVQQRPGEPPMVRRGDATHPDRFRFSPIIPTGYHLVSEPNSGVMGAGIALFAASYLTFAVIGTASGSPESLIPFVGPILSYRPSTHWFSSLTNGLSLIAIGIDVTAQVAGATMLIVGAAVPRRWLERDVTAPTSPTISFAPLAPGADVGASVSGRF